MAKLTNDLKDLREKNVSDLEKLILEIRENQFKNSKIQHEKESHQLRWNWQ